MVVRSRQPHLKRPMGCRGGGLSPRAAASSSAPRRSRRAPASCRPSPNCRGSTSIPPAIDIRAAGVTVRLISVSADYLGMTDTDVEVAQRISTLGRELGLSADRRHRALLVIPGAPDIKQVMPFWRAVLGYEPRIASGRGSGRSAGSRRTLLVRDHAGAALRRRRRDPYLGLGPARPGGGAHRGGAGRRWPHGAR